MLDGQVVANLLLDVDVGVGLVRHGHLLCEDSSVRRARRPALAAVTKGGYSKKRHAGACGVHYAGPTGILCSAGVAATPPAFRFA